MSVKDSVAPADALTWNCQLELYFKNTGEQAQCLSILHSRCEAVFSKRKVYIDLPVFIGSGVIAFLNAASSNIFEGQSQMSSVALGVGSLVVGVLNTIGSYFAWAKRAEGHRISQIQYSRLYRFLAIELTLQRDQRMSPRDLLKYTRDSYDRLQEISPQISPDILQSFGREYKKYNVSKPEGANGLESISVFQEYNLFCEEQQDCAKQCTKQFVEQVAKQNNFVDQERNNSTRNNSIVSTQEIQHSNSSIYEEFTVQNLDLDENVPFEFLEK